MNYNIPYYQATLSDSIKDRLLSESHPIDGIEHLLLHGKMGGLESKESFSFLVSVWKRVHDELALVMQRRLEDRDFIDKRNKSIKVYNQVLRNKFETKEYKTLIGEPDSNGRIVIGPLQKGYAKYHGQKKVADIPHYLQGPHVTLFGPPDSEKMCINAMNAFHRKLKNEPKIVAELVENINYTPKWGADNEDSKTPLHTDFQSAGINLSRCLDHDLEFIDEKGKEYKLAENHLSHAIKRFPGLALPSFFLFYQDEPVPLHIYDFALHVFKNWSNPEALVFYVPKLENEEEARYIKNLMLAAEEEIKKLHPEYKIGTIRLMIVLENPRAVFRVHEIMDELYPYFLGASLGWHDYLGSTARLFKEDPNYRIPVKADPDIVIKYIKASHRLLADVVGARGGIKVGGMYGILPTTYDIETNSFQVTLYGYFRDVITQLKRDLTGFWVAHPDFVRIGMAIVEAWKIYQNGDFSKLEQLVRGLLQEKYQDEIINFIKGADIDGLDIDDPLYDRSLLVADVGTSNIIANNHPDEIRYNVFQSLQYITDWLSGNGCVALPTNIKNEAVRIMDDLATAERSRWEVWHEIYHGRFDLFDFLKIAHEELHFIRKDLSNDKKIVQVKWNESNAKWYPVAMKLMIKLMTDKKPCEFAPELLLPFTIGSIRTAEDPWAEVQKWDQEKYQLDPMVERFHEYFERCGSLRFASQMAQNPLFDHQLAEKLVMSFTVEEIIEAASFHGNIGESKKTLDKMATQEQAKVFNEEQSVLDQLKEMGDAYKKRHGFKFLISAKGKTGTEMLEILKQRLNRTTSEEIEEAKRALLEITIKRIDNVPDVQVTRKIQDDLKRFKIKQCQIGLSDSGSATTQINFNCDSSHLFEIASLSKTIGSLIALEILKENHLSEKDSVNEVLISLGSSFQLKDSEGNIRNDVIFEHLMSHSALNMHYVFGIPLNDENPQTKNFLNGNEKYGYGPILVLHKPGTKFSYSGAGFIVLEHLIELISNKSFPELLAQFLLKYGIEGIFCENQIPDEALCVFGAGENGDLLSFKRLKFPTIAAGMLGTANSVQNFLQLMTRAFGDCSHPLHVSVVRMCYGRDLGSKKFMNAFMGLGVFVAECGENRLLLHQGANDGFRAIFVHCFSGPDAGKGFTILATGEINAVKAIAMLSQKLLKHLRIRGVDYSLFQDSFSSSGVKQEEVVNIGYKELVFNAFKEDLPEVYEHKTLDPLCSFNHVVGSQIIEVSNQKFARAENLISPYLPVFDPAFYGRQGKVMDSWESARHNPLDYDSLKIKFEFPVNISYASICTKFHLGNQFSHLELIGFDVQGNEHLLLPKTKIEGHSFLKIKLDKEFRDIRFVLVKAFPDGGLTRIGLYEEIPSSEARNFLSLSSAKNIKYSDEIPVPQKPLSLKYSFQINDIKRHWEATLPNNLIDVACAAFGGEIISQSNQHYGPAVSTISPFAPIDMFDGFETARSRKPDNFEELVIKFGRPSKLENVVCDFTYFVNNNPRDLSIDALIDDHWETIVPRQFVKPFAGNKISFYLNEKRVIQQLKVKCYPDGGINRIHAYARI